MDTQDLTVKIQYIFLSCVTCSPIRGAVLQIHIELTRVGGDILSPFIGLNGRLLAQNSTFCNAWHDSLKFPEFEMGEKFIWLTSVCVCVKKKIYWLD